MSDPGNRKLSGDELAAVMRLSDSTLRRHQSTGPGTPRKQDAGQSYDTSFESLPGYRSMLLQRSLGDAVGVENPYYRLHETRAGAASRIGGRQIINFASYDYLGLNGHPEVVAAATEAAAAFGTSVSASRMTAGERQLHRDLEAELAGVYQAEDAVVFVSGHASAVSTIGALLEPRDLLLHDSLAHNCIIMGGQMSQATRRAFPHNDLDALERLLASERHKHNRVLIATEGLFSMDGDGPDLQRLVDIKARYGCWLMVDDAHGLGVLGSCGRGIFEHLGIEPGAIDIWLGTLSKSMVSCGGYVAGSRALVEFLKFAAPGLVYSVGMPAPAAAAALTALRIMLREPERVRRQQENSEHFLKHARELKLDTGQSWGRGIVPVFIGDTLRTALLAQNLLDRGINAFPILPPGVPEQTARLRFFLSSEHGREEIDIALSTLREELDKLVESGVSVGSFNRLIKPRAD